MRFCITIDTEPDYNNGGYEKMKSGLINAEKLLSKYKINPTLFVTCDCIEKYPKLFRYYRLASWRKAAALSVCSQLKLDSVRPKWP